MYRKCMLTEMFNCKISLKTLSYHSVYFYIKEHSYMTCLNVQTTVTKSERNAPFHKKNKIINHSPTVDCSTAWVHPPDFLSLCFHPHKWSKQMTISVQRRDGAHKRESDSHFHNRCFYRGVSSLRWAVSHMRDPQKLQRNVQKTNM